MEKADVVYISVHEEGGGEIPKILIWWNSEKYNLTRIKYVNDWEP